MLLCGLETEEPWEVAVRSQEGRLQNRGWKVTGVFVSRPGCPGEGW